MAKALVEVCIRHEEQAEATHLCYWAPDDLATLVAAIDANGVYYNGNTWSVSGQQFVLGAVDAYAELILGGDPR